MEAFKEYAAIGWESLKLVGEDTKAWLGRKVAQLDEWLCDFGDDDV